MKPFNLEQAKAGKPVQTRDGRAARIICFDAQDYNNEKYIVALVTNKEGIEHPSSYALNGNSCGVDDLMMKSEKKTGWVNVYTDMPEYVKFEDNNIVYYYRAHIMSQNKFIELRTSPILGRMMLADFVFDRNTNKLLKCRESLEHILDKFTGIDNG